MPESSESQNSQNSPMAPSVRLPSPTRAIIQGGSSRRDNGSGSVVGQLSSSSYSNLAAAQRKNRLNSAKYYDIASTILAGGPDFDELFLAAARDGEYDKIEHFLQGRSDVIISIDAKDKRTGNTPLIWAAKKGHAKIVQLLLKHGADPTLRNYEGQVAVEVALASIKMILLDSVEKTTESSHRLLLQAAWQGNIKIVRKLLRENKVKDINCQNAEGLTPLLLATRDSQLFERLSLQLNRSYNPVEVIQELLANRANIHASDCDEKTCLHHASHSRATLAQSLVDVLIREGSELELRDKRHFMPIHWASHSGNTNVVVALLDGGSEVNSRGFAGLTPLHITAHNDHNKTAVALLERGADVTVTDDRGLTAVDLAKTRKMKTTLKEAWAEQTHMKQTTTLAPVRAPSREESRMSMDDCGKRRKGEVIFDGLITSPRSSKTGPMSRPTFSRCLSNADKARRAEQQMMKDVDSGRFTPTPKENVRRLGTLRGSAKTSTLPKVVTGSCGPPSSPDRASPQSSTGRKSSLEDVDIRRSLEDVRPGGVRRSLDDGRPGGVRRSKSQKLGNIPSDRRRITPTSAGEVTQEEFCVLNNRVSPVPHEMQTRGRHRRTGSDPFIPPILADLAKSCDNYLPRRGRSLSNSEEYDLDKQMRMTPLRTPLDREMTNLNIPTTIPEVLTPRTTTSAVFVDIDTNRSSTPAQLISLHPNSSNVLPPTPTFITQKSYSILDAKLVHIAKEGDSSKECSPRSDEDLPKISKEQVRVLLSNPYELLRSRSLLKEEFVIDESRPKDPLLHSSGSDPTSSASSLSSSPRDNSVNILILNKTGKSVKEYHSPLSKVGRYSISGPNNNVGERFRNKVTRSKSLSSTPSRSRSNEKLSEMQNVGISGNVLKKPVYKQNSLDSAVQSKAKSSGSNKDISKTGVDHNMNNCVVPGNDNGDVPKACDNSVQVSSVSGGCDKTCEVTDSNLKSNQPNTMSSASTRQPNTKQGSNQRVSSSCGIAKKAQSNSSAKSSTGVQNVPKIVRNAKTPQGNRVNRNASPLRSSSGVTSSRAASTLTSISVTVGSEEDCKNCSVMPSPSSPDTNAVTISVNSASENIPKNVLSVSKNVGSKEINLRSGSAKPAVGSLSKGNSTAINQTKQSSVQASAVKTKVTPRKPNTASSKTGATPSATPASVSSKSVPSKSIPSTSVSVCKTSLKESNSVCNTVSCSTKLSAAVPSSHLHTTSNPACSVSSPNQPKSESSSQEPAKVLTPKPVPKLESPMKSLRSPSDSQLNVKSSNQEKGNNMRKSDSWRYVKPCQENKEPLVRISLPGQDPRPHISEPGSIGSTFVMQTPVIVNPFENWIQPEIVITSRTSSDDHNNTDIAKGGTSSYGFVIGKSSKDATCKLKKNRNVKSAKKTKDMKRPVSGGQRQSSGRRRGAKSQDSKTSEQSENGRVKSGKSGKRVKSGRKRKKDLETEALKTNAAKPDVALISGIGWHVAAGCNDTSDVKVATHLYCSDSEDSDIEVINPEDNYFKLLTARTEGAVSPSTPRFQEIKAAAEVRIPLPVMSHDGFPPMNLDMTQEMFPAPRSNQTSFAVSNAEEEEDYTNDFDDLTNALHKEIMLGKLTPIPESPSVSHSVQAAINRFDQTVKEDQLNKMLGIIAGESLSSQQAEALRQAKHDSCTSADSRVRRSGSIRKEVLTHESAKARVKATGKTESPGSASKKTVPGKTVVKSKASNSGIKGSTSNVKGSKENLSLLKEEPKGAASSEKGKPIEAVAKEEDNLSKGIRRERKFSESKKEDEEIDEAIEEILNATGNSLSSTLKSNNNNKSLSSTLTEADRNVLRRLKNNESMFHAKTADKDDVRHSDSYAQDTNPNLLKVFHAENFNLGSKVKAMIDAGADPSKVKAMIDADEEAKQLAKVMNSFRHMELHAGGAGGSVRLSKDTPRKHNSVPRPEGSSDGPSMTRKPPSGRPSSAGGLRKGKFHEMKAITPRIQGNQSSLKHVETSIVQEEMDVLEKLSEAVAAEVADPILANTSDGETLCSRLSGRRGSRTGSACTEDSIGSSIEETIQWKKGNVLGKGAFGTVWCGLTNEGELIAVKQIDLNTTDMDKAHREYEKVQEEVELLKNLRHKNIVGYMGTSFEDYTVSIFMQFVPGGSIASILARFGALDESVFRRYTRQILEGVEYLHENDVIHRDIKGGNVMLMPNGDIKLIDFGCAKRLCINLSMSQSQILKSMKGTPYWMAPEVVNETGHGKKSDIWSVGCTVFEMATRKPPWSDMNPMAAIFAIGSDKPAPTLPEDKFSPEAREFVMKCLTRDQNIRSSATELLQDVFILKKSSKK
ncbi:uncharacterized protein LOC124145836 [Haliotis rufescens]|uniref:uncharacterized protein LOC124145836 n=1 Tax=Haliotis rufescens TaxID=6454 RepID=UPI00201EA1F0|nr:uncharacterized protein LOC124145836 [Haliotis rufescens]